MKKLILLVLLISASGELFAQKTGLADRTFGIPSYQITREFTIQLENGNRIELEMTDLEGLEYFKHTDSIVAEFLKDIKPFKDSLSDVLSTKRIDYVMDSSSLRKIRIQKFKSKSDNFVVNKKDIASLKLDQDTIFIIVVKRETQNKNRKIQFGSYYRMSFYLNALNDISSCLDEGLEEKIIALSNINQPWVRNKSGQLSLKDHPEITAIAPQGNVFGGTSLSYRISADVQNYKNYFVPSASFGLSITSHENLLVKEWYAGVEDHFLFAKDIKGKLKTYQNLFLTFSFSLSSEIMRTRIQGSILTPKISLGYLVSRSGEYYNKNTFKLNMGRYSFSRGTTSIEPTFYFNNFFKGVTPSLRLVQNF